ncbi:hypothetical protein ACROAH_21370 [Shewanella oncorhynchi]|uniref:hypothetical protein n=1 Tax=Shewanella TaxID=22 RepID=UPI0039AEEA58
MKINLRDLNAIHPAPLSDVVLPNLSDIENESGWDIDRDEDHFTYETVPYELIVGHDQRMISAVSWGDLLNGRHTSMGYYLGLLEDRPNFFTDQFWPKDGVSLAKLEGKYYLVGGKHRVTVNYFLRHFNPMTFNHSIVIPNVKVQHYTLK